MSEWVQLRDESWVDSVAPPRVMVASAVGEGVQRLGHLGVKVHIMEVGHAASTFDVVTELRRVLPLPTWCGSSWDSVDDAFEEMRHRLIFPAALIVDGASILIDSNLRLGLETVVRLNELERAFAVASEQMLVFFVNSTGVKQGR